MAILVDETHARAWCRGSPAARAGRAPKLMRDYGTRVVAGCTPGRGGETVDGVPVYDTVLEAVEAHGGLRRQRDLRAGAAGQGRGPRGDRRGRPAHGAGGRPRPGVGRPRDRARRRARGGELPRPQHPRRPLGREGRSGDDRGPGRVGTGLVQAGPGGCGLALRRHDLVDRVLPVARRRRAVHTGARRRRRDRGPAAAGRGPPLPGRPRAPRASRCSARSAARRRSASPS